MMRSMYSAVSGLKTHQTKMDVIGNNIANVNTVAFKASSVTFQDLLYQNTSGASGANNLTGAGGINAKQIGLGVNMASTNINITGAGAAETTGRGFDIRLTDQSTTNFFIVNNGSENVFTRSGSFYVDGAGNLCMTSTGYTVMGWQVDPTTGNIRKDTVSPLRIMKTENLTSMPEPTTKGTCAGIIDRNDPDVVSDAGLVKNLTFYDKLGYAYTARFVIKSTGNSGEFSVSLASIFDSEGKMIYDAEDTTATNAPALTDIFGKNDTITKSYSVTSDYSGCTFDAGTIDTDASPATISGTDSEGNAITKSLKDVYGLSNDMIQKLADGTGTATITNGVLSIEYASVDYKLNFSTANGIFDNIDGADFVTLNMTQFGDNFEDIEIDFAGTQNSANGGKTTATMTSGDTDGTTGKGKKLGNLIGLSVDQQGQISGTYDNGNTVLLGQIAVAQFPNASGLEKVGDNCYTTTLNSGEFDGIGVDITADGSSMVSGELEMSNVDLSTEFTQMIVTQRGFQANSRVITTSDSLLEELVNLKR